MNESRADSGGSRSWGPDGWIPGDCETQLRALLARHLSGEPYTPADVTAIARRLADAARGSGQAAEQLPIAVRALWRSLGLSHSERLQASALYDDVVRSAIERYYGE